MFPGLFREIMLLFSRGATVGQNNHDALHGRENGSPRLTNSSLNLSGFSENGKTLLTY